MTEKFRRTVLLMFGGRCAYPGCPNKATDAHHALVHDTKPNNIKFPLFIKSIFNFRPICKQCHQAHQHFWNIPDMLATIYETWLKEFRGVE